MADPYDQTFRGMPDNLVSAAKRNLAATDRMIVGFNTTARTIAPIAGGTPAPIVTPPTSFQFPSLASNLTDQLSIGGTLPQVNATSRITPPLNSSNTTGAIGSDPTLYGGYKTNPDAFTKNPDAYAKNPDAYGSVSSPINPQRKQQFQEQYGW